jgi:sugar phosphate isomerase/epimerase
MGADQAMKEPWQSYLELGIVHFMAFPECLTGEGPQFDTLAEICHDPFFDAVDVGPMNDAEERRRCAALFRDCQMTVTFACQPVQIRRGLDLNSPDRHKRQEAVEAILACIDEAKELGATRLALMSGRNVPQADQAAALDRLVKELCRICRAAKERAALPVVLEIFDYDMDKKALIGTCAAAASLAKAVRKEFPDFGLLHDLSHIYLCHEKPAEHFPLIREHLVAVHMGNSVSDRNHPLFGDTHPHFGMAGSDSDVAQLREFIRTLFDIGLLRPGRRPVCGFEIRPPQGVASKTAIANLKRTWQRAWWTL